MRSKDVLSPGKSSRASSLFFVFGLESNFKEGCRNGNRRSSAAVDPSGDKVDDSDLVAVALVITRVVIYVRSVLDPKTALYGFKSVRIIDQDRKHWFGVRAV